jgi:anti-sigma factor RsiW
MNCELAHKRMVMATYGELADAEAHELNRHLSSCAECGQQWAQLEALKVLAGALSVEEPGANLVARSRLRLEEALDALPLERWPMLWLGRLGQRMRNGLASLQAAPVAACLLVGIAAGAGSFGGYKLAEGRVTAQMTARTVSNLTASRATGNAQVEVANVSSILRQPNSEIVEVHYNQLVPQQIQGSVDDPAIRQLLMLASQNTASPGVRDDSVGLMAAACKAGRSCRGAGIRDALMVALRYDRNAGVREKALAGLEPYVAEDVKVRDAVLEALMNDSEPRIRILAISLLAPVEGDTSVRQVLHSVANTDQNSQIRTVSRQVLSRVSVIQ